MKTFIYVISGEHGRQKIGASDNPKQRLKDLQTASPYPLKIEFIGEVQDGAAGQVEAETHFTLNAHKSPGGDEWFTVPSDVAITAIMAAAHRLGYRIRPVDEDKVIPQISGRQPLWLMIAMLPFFAAYLYWIFWIADPRIASGDLPLTAFAIEALLLFGVLMIIRYFVRYVGSQIIAIWHWFQIVMGWVREQTSRDRTEPHVGP